MGERMETGRESDSHETTVIYRERPFDNPAVRGSRGNAERAQSDRGRGIPPQNDKKQDAYTDLLIRLDRIEGGSPASHRRRRPGVESIGATEELTT